MRWWKDLSVSKKLYAVVGVMALLIASELFTLLFAMDVLSSVRSFVHGEGLWSKAQKDAIYNLHRYAFTHDVRFYEQFKNNLKISEGDHDARIAMESPALNREAAIDGFIRGGNHPDDIPGLIKLIRRFYWISYIDKALKIWRSADELLMQIIREAGNLHAALQSPTPQPRKVDQALSNIDRLNEELTKIEAEFSTVLGEGSRWLEHMLMTLLILAVLTVESTGLFLTITFSRNLNRSLKELKNTADKVGQGDFSHQVPVRSRDELGQLAAAINKMSRDLENSIGRRKKAESASQVKTIFLANMSHEIRTPLGVMMGLTEILKDPSLSWEDHQRYVDTMEKTGKNLAQIINDILDISKVETGHVEIEKTRFSLNQFVTELSSMLKVQAQRTANELRFSPEGTLPQYVTTDRVRLRQILINLVNNALKYTEKGQVNVRYSVTKGQIVFEVSDTGAGISTEGQEKLFQIFSRANDAESASNEGSGLGLALSKRLANALDGDVILQSSEVGKGSTFRVTIANDESMPVAAESDKSSATETGKLEGRRVLVVEDSSDNQLLVNLFLARRGMNVDFANNGEEGYKAALNSDYDLILMDMQMPVMDGYLATKQLREKGYRKPIIALTAHAMKDDRDRCMKAGCDDYLTKPIDSAVLYSTLARHLPNA